MLTSPFRVLLQDWISDKELSGPLDKYAQDWGFTPSQPTNRNLARPHN